MKLRRRQFLHLAAGFAALPAIQRIAQAQSYPARPVAIILGFPAGGGFDFDARPVGRWLSDRLGQPFNVENRLGAGSHIATEAVVHAPADGNTLLTATAANALPSRKTDSLTCVLSDHALGCRRGAPNSYPAIVRRWDEATGSNAPFCPRQGCSPH